jgi:hypothetical protein
MTPLFHHDPSQPPAGMQLWYCTAGIFADDDVTLVAVSNCEEVANNEHTARRMAAVTLGAEPGAIEVTNMDLAMKGQ